MTSRFSFPYPDDDGRDDQRQDNHPSRKPGSQTAAGEFLAGATRLKLDCWAVGGSVHLTYELSGSLAAGDEAEERVAFSMFRRLLAGFQAAVAERERGADDD